MRNAPVLCRTQLAARAALNHGFILVLSQSMRCVEQGCLRLPIYWARCAASKKAATGHPSSFASRARHARGSLPRVQGICIFPPPSPAGGNPAAPPCGITIEEAA